MDINQFFKEFSVDDTEIDPAALKYNTGVLEAFARAAGRSFYVIDYNKRGFAYVSPGSLFLCGHTAEEALGMGYSFYEKIMPEEDLDMLLEINRKGFELFHSIPIGQRINLTISYDFRLRQPDGQFIMVNHKLTPIQLTPSGEIWLALCSVVPSGRREPGNVFVRMNGELHLFHYSFSGQRWHDSEIISLTEREKEVLLFSVQGLTNEEAAERMFLDMNTVKFHKRHLFDKLRVRNITEAINFAYNNWLL